MANRNTQTAVKSLLSCVESDSSQNVGVSGTMTASSFYGNGANVTNIAAGNITSGIMDNARLNNASTTSKGIVQLYNGSDSKSTTLAATANALNIVQNKIGNLINYNYLGTTASGGTTYFSVLSLGIIDLIFWEYPVDYTKLTSNGTTVSINFILPVAYNSAYATSGNPFSTSYSSILQIQTSQVTSPGSAPAVGCDVKHYDTSSVAVSFSDHNVTRIFVSVMGKRN